MKVDESTVAEGKLSMFAAVPSMYDYLRYRGFSIADT